MIGTGRCPTCKRAIPPEADGAAFRPFCSQRCKMADLGNWLDGVYRISLPVSDEEPDHGAVRAQNDLDE